MLLAGFFCFRPGFLPYQPGFRIHHVRRLRRFYDKGAVAVANESANWKCSNSSWSSLCPILLYRVPPFDFSVRFDPQPGSERSGPQSSSISRCHTQFSVSRLIAICTLFWSLPKYKQDAALWACQQGNPGHGDSDSSEDDSDSEADRPRTRRAWALDGS